MMTQSVERLPENHFLLPQKLIAYFATDDSAFYIQVQKNQMMEYVFTPQEFSDFKHMLKQELVNASHIAEMQETLKELEQQISQNLQHSGMEVHVELEQPIFLPVSSESERHLSLPALMNATASYEQKETRILFIATMNLVLVRQHVISINLYDRYQGMHSETDIKKKTEEYLHTIFAANE